MLMWSFDIHTLIENEQHEYQWKDYMLHFDRIIWAGEMIDLKSQLTSSPTFVSGVALSFEVPVFDIDMAVFYILQNW